MNGAALDVGDIVDLRAYERVREDYRREVMARKRLRRLGLGPIMTVLFECAETIRFQIQEMARVEKIATDEGIQAELDVYNPLLPAPGELSATLFIELTSEEELRTWLPRLVGVERSLVLVVGDPAARPAEVWSEPEERHAESLTRETVTPAVHYVRFRVAPEVVQRLRGDEAARLEVRHPEYRAATEVPEASRTELLGDLEGRSDLLRLA